MSATFLHIPSPTFGPVTEVVATPRSGVPSRADLNSAVIRGWDAIRAEIAATTAWAQAAEAPGHPAYFSLDER